jgi:hypothetical protein
MIVLFQLITANNTFTTYHLGTTRVILLGTPRYETPCHFPSSNTDSAAYTQKTTNVGDTLVEIRSLVPKGL